MSIESLKLEIDEWLEEYFNDKGTLNSEIYKAMNYSISVGGKRIRPILLCCTYDMYSDNYTEVLPISCAIEMIHTYSLIHDDLPAMDNDDLRRGHPTNHKVFGEAIAILAGDGLLNEAMNVMFNYCLGKDEKELLACKIISEGAGVEGMIGGQVVDILSEGKKVSYETISYMHKKKTGALIKASILAGAILGNATEEEIEKLTVFGEKLGLAFQIKDDILDVTGEEEVMGKAVNSDINNDKTTFITTFGLEECKEMCKKLTEECMGILESLHRNTNNLKEITEFLLNRDY